LTLSFEIDFSIRWLGFIATLSCSFEEPMSSSINIINGVLSLSKMLIAHFCQ